MFVWFELNLELKIVKNSYAYIMSRAFRDVLD